MPELLVIGYRDLATAEAARADLLSMRDALPEIGNAVVAVADESGEVTLSQRVNMWAVGRRGGALWQLLGGLLFLHPHVASGRTGETADMEAAMEEYGVDRPFMEDVADMLAPGQAALFVMAEPRTSQKALRKLARHGGSDVRTSLDDEREDRVRRAVERVHAEHAGAIAEAA